MTKSFNHYFQMTGIALVSLVILFAWAITAHANPFYSASSARSAAATTTLAYLTPGAATTTTPVYDSYEVNGTNETNQGNFTIPDTVAVLLQGQASSSASTLNATCEFSEDKVDWYQNQIFPSTTTPSLIGAPQSFQFAYASSTAQVGGAPPAAISATSSRFQKLVTCPVPLRYVRLVVTDTGGNLAVWSAIVPTKQRN